MFEIPNLRKFKIPELRGLKIPDLRRFKIPDFAGSRFLKTHFTNFIKLDVSRVTDFPEFPNTPLGNLLYKYNGSRSWIPPLQLY
jgi:hypothetical protein